VIPTGSGSTHGRPTPGPAGRRTTWVSGRVLDDLIGRLQQQLCFAVRDFERFDLWEQLAIVFFLAIASPGAWPEKSPRTRLHPLHPQYFFPPRSIWKTGKDVIEITATASTTKRSRAAAQKQYVIDRIGSWGIAG